MRKVVIFGDSGEEKSRIALGLAKYWGQENNVLLLNFLSGERVLEEALDREVVVYDIYDYLTSVCRLDQILIESDEKGVFLFPSSYKIDKAKLDETNINRIEDLEFPIQIAIAGKKEDENKQLQYWATDRLYMEQEKEIGQENEFYFGKERNSEAIYLGATTYWQEDFSLLANAVWKRESIEFSKNLWEKIKEFLTV